MQIIISEKLLPFSTRAGVSVLLPGTSLRVTVYPTRIELHNLSTAFSKNLGAINIHLEEPAIPTVQLDLVKGCIRVWGESAQGYYRYNLSFSEGLHLQLENGSLELSGEALTLDKVSEKTWQIHTSEPYAHLTVRPKLERISFGSHRKQDMDLMQRRNDFAELFPIWFQLGQWIPNPGFAVYEGTASLIPACCTAIQGNRNDIIKAFERLFRAAFKDLFSPSLKDELYLGFDLKPLAKNSLANPLQIVVEGALLIRSLLVQKYDETYFILPALPVAFHCGRALNIKLGDKALLDIEWTKKQLRRMIVHSNITGEIRFRFPSDIKTFRLRTHENDRGRFLNASDVITFEKDQSFYFDRFQK